MKEGDTTERVSINKELGEIFVKGSKDLSIQSRLWIAICMGDTEAATLAIKDLKRFEEERNKT